MNKIVKAYYLFECLPDEVKQAYGFKSKARRDCILFADEVPGGYRGLDYYTNKKGQLCLYLTPVKSFANADYRRLAEWSLTNNSMNLTSIFIEDTDYPQYGYGYPNANRMLSGGMLNPLFIYRQDAYLFISNPDYTKIELLVLPECRNLITACYQRLIDGDLDDEIQRLKDQTKIYFRYHAADSGI